MFIPVKEDRRLRVSQSCQHARGGSRMDRQDDRFSEKPEAKWKRWGRRPTSISIPYSGVEHRSVPIDKLAVIRQDALTPCEEVFLERNEIRRCGPL